MFQVKNTVELPPITALHDTKQPTISQCSNIIDCYYKENICPGRSWFGIDFTLELDRLRKAWRRLGLLISALERGVVGPGRPQKPSHYYDIDSTLRKSDAPLGPWLWLCLSNGFQSSGVFF